MSRKNGSKRREAAAPCPYCARPEIFEPRTDEPANLLSASAHLSGKYWYRREDDPHPSVRTFPELQFKDGERRFRISGYKNFTQPYQGFEVEVIGLEFPFRPLISVGPGFHQSIPQGFEERGETMRSYAACRITHRKTGVIADAHFWHTHGLLITLKHLPKNPTGEAITAARRLLDLFATDYRGAPKITRDFIMTAFEKLGSEATQAAVARELAVTERALQKWAEREGIKGWEAMRKNFAPWRPTSLPEQTS